jgi:hypothetical protein
MNEKLKVLLERTVKATELLARTSPPTDTVFMTVLAGIYRISFLTLRDIYYLSLQEDTGASILDLVRKMIEHTVSVEYMFLLGKEESAVRFQEHLKQELYKEIIFFKMRDDIMADVTEEFKEMVNAVDVDYHNLPNDRRKDKTWSGKSIEEIIKILADKKVMDSADYSRVSQAYLWGCWLNHPNPKIVNHYLNDKVYRKQSSFYCTIGVSLSISMHIRLTRRLIEESSIKEEVNLYSEAAKEIALIQSEFDALEA